MKSALFKKSTHFKAGEKPLCTFSDPFHRHHPSLSRGRKGSHSSLTKHRHLRAERELDNLIFISIYQDQKKKKSKFPRCSNPTSKWALKEQCLPGEHLPPELLSQLGICACHPHACELATDLFLHQVGTKGQLVFLLSSAVSLGNFEKLSDVQQCLADVVPKSLGVLWGPRA